MNSEAWLDEMLWCGGSNYSTRRAIIWRFTKYGIFPFLHSHGYSLQVTAKDMSCGIASLLFHNRGHTLITPFIIDTKNDYIIEHKEHYTHVIDSSQWNSLWDAWSFWEDISPEYGHGFYRRLDIEEYCWSQIDLHNSKQTYIVEELMEGGDGNSNGNAREEYEEY